MLAVAGVAALPLLTGCGSSNADNATAAAPAPKPATVAPKPAAAAPKAAATPTSGPVKVKLTEWAVTPSTTVAKAGKVTFDVTNAGQVPHEMVVIRTDKQAGALGKGQRISEKGSVGEAGDVAAGRTKSVTLKLAPGHYALVCNIPSHYMSGMHTDFTVR